MCLMVLRGVMVGHCEDQDDAILLGTKMLHLIGWMMVEE